MPLLPRFGVPLQPHRVEDLVLVNVASVLVMVPMGQLPWIVGYHDQTSLRDCVNGKKGFVTYF